MNTSIDIDYALLADHFFRIAVAYALALPIGWDRERTSRSAGLRTYPLVAIGACGFLLVGKSFLDTGDANARLMQGLLGGLGFIAGGAILKNSENVKGMATAASIWITGAIGMCVAYGRIEIAIILSVVSWATLVAGRKIKPFVNDDSD